MANQMKALTILISLFVLFNLYGKQVIEIPSIFSDNMVLQQNSDVSFWGKAEANQNVNVTGSWGSTANTSVQADGSFMLKLKTPKAGGPYQVYLQIGDTTIIYKNVLIGEVWVCSGQSNMEMPLSGWLPGDSIANSDYEIKNANNNYIRLFTVSRAVSNKKEFNCIGNWKKMNPETVSEFSATAFFFAKKLYEELKIPIGLIHISWGGTPAEAWSSNEFLKPLGDFDEVLGKMKTSDDEFIKYKNWLNEHTVIDLRNNQADTRWENLSFNDDSCSTISFNDSQWKEMNLPTKWESTEAGNFDGVIWFRKKIQVPDNWKNQELVLNLGPIDDMDRTYVNGKLVGAVEKTGFWQKDRIYKVPKELVQSNELVIAVRVMDNQGGGGIWGANEKLNIHSLISDEKISLSGNWKYLPVAEYQEQIFYVFGVDKNDYYQRPIMSVEISAYSPTTLYNAMIHPLIPYNIKGVIWYQGEANVGNPKQYQKLFPSMIKNWRNDWKLGDFPFYYVQIAPYNYGEQSHSELLREAQLKSLSVPNTGMVVTLDIGNPQNIHPSNKNDVGGRLALIALAKTYNKKNSYSGPVYKSMKIQKDKIILTFDYSKSGLVLKELNGENNFLIAGPDKVFKKAKVKIENNKFIVTSDEVKNPVAVRYAFTNTSEATLFNKDGLPASSFRTDDWDN
jgi:sialate O-acetylesterase